MNQNSPIYGGFASPPPTYPLGVSIKNKVSVDTIQQRVAKRVYEAHHSYLPRIRSGTHYGVFLDNELVGAITFDAWPSSATIQEYESNQIREVARVCIAHDTPNLASCGMAKTQDDYVSELPERIKLLVTYVRDDYQGSMFAALSGKGWQKDGVSKPAPPGNRDTYDIHDWEKERWICPVNRQ